VLIVEDEPAAARYLRSMIELKNPDFQIVGTAANGQDALAQVRTLLPDLVMTDVKMPVMDGIEFVAKLKKEYPTLLAIIVSGYQEFEYARRALATGVVDYLLKPIDPVRLREVLDRLGSTLALRAEEARAGVLLRVINGEPCESVAGSDANAAIGPDDLFWLATMRVGGLPSRFRIEAAVDERATCRDDFYVLPGCDSRERIFLGSKLKLSYEDFIRQVCTEADAVGGTFRTALVLSNALRVAELQKSACEACMRVDSLVVAGLSQVRYGMTKPAQDVEWDRVLAARIEFALLESRTDLLEQAIRDLVAGWKVRRLPLISVESQLRRILHFVLRKAPHADVSVDANLEFLLEDALGGVGDFGDIADAAWSLVAKAAGTGCGDFRDSDVPAFFHAITRHVEERYAESLNLASLSTTFRISSSYLSKLFRQHAGRSFGEYLSSIRIEVAKRLIRENPAMPLRDVAERVGFQDPFYFSRVFKSAVGKAPSEYARSDE